MREEGGLGVNLALSRPFRLRAHYGRQAVGIERLSSRTVEVVGEGIPHGKGHSSA